MGVFRAWVRFAAVGALVAGALVPARAGQANTLLACTSTLLGKSTTRLPDLRTVVPQHLNLVNQQQRELLRFSNLIANTGAGPWRLRPEFPLNASAPNAQQRAIQQVLNSEDSSGSVVCEKLVSEFLFHAEHNHWHTAGVALFEVRVGSPTGPVFVNDRGVPNSLKTTFCLIDWVHLTGNSNTGSKSTRTYWDCFGSFHGISVGWADQYHQSVPGQELDITGARAGQEYFLVSTTNPDGTFLESTTANNRAWQGFRVSRDSNGNPKITLTSTSPCEPGTGLCGEQTANR